MTLELLEPRFLLLYIYLAAALYVHLRGQVRVPLHKQLFNHSTLLAPYNALMYLFSAVQARPYIEIAHFPELAPLRDNWQRIRDEAAGLLDAGQIGTATGNNDVGFNSFLKRGWRRFYIKWYDDALPSAQQLCPETTALLNAIPSVNAAMFALLPPGAKLNPHRDPFAGSLRYHLGLITPNSKDCHILVDGIAYHWRDGEAVMFDETYIHEACNNTGQTRLILFCDIERPLGNRLLSWINRVLVRPLVKSSATQNVVGERVGLLNRFYGRVYHPVATFLENAFRHLKRFNRPLYRIVKTGLIVAVLYVIFV